MTRRTPPQPRLKPPPQEDEYATYPYQALLLAADIGRNPLVLTLAEIHHRWFKALDKTEPVILSNAVFLACGFDHHAKWKALAVLERAGMIKIVKREKKSPLVYVLFKERKPTLSKTTNMGGRTHVHGRKNPGSWAEAPIRAY
jgi:hypothetical protein